MVLKHIKCYRYALPLKSPVALPFGSVFQREGILIALTTDQGEQAWGEAAPLPGFSVESLTEAASEIQRIAPFLLEKPLDEAHDIIRPQEARFPSVYFAFHSALASFTGNPQLPEVNTPALPLCALLDDGPEAFETRLSKVLDTGYTAVKLKVGRGTLADDVEKVRHITAVLPSECVLRLDANRAWARDDALKFCDVLPAERIQYIEEPTQSAADIPGIQEQTGVPCAVDETLQELSAGICAGSPKGLQTKLNTWQEIAGQARYWIWKPSLCLPPPLLGVTIGRPVVLSGAYESGVGTAAILRYAAGLIPECPSAGVDTYTRLAHDVLEKTLPLEGPVADMTTITSLARAVNTSTLEFKWRVG